ncbi:MAG: hypothetical protein LUD68_02665 [Rikenellaceae bacterium]|nr:hypothetical protein [Rikenellaceae bacterium]
MRIYNGEPLKSDELRVIREYIHSLGQPLGGNARVELIRKPMGADAVKLGTYGVISGASDFLVLIYQPGKLAEENAGYLFEQVVLFCTERGLGTCWLEGTLRKSDFAAMVELKEEDVLRIVSPVGYPAEKKRLIERLLRAGAGSDNRKPFGSLFFDHTFDKPLREESAGEFLLPLQMLRLAPSASNTQPWQVVLKDRNLHFYYQDKSRFSSIDLGIALCHFGETCREQGLHGKFSQLGPEEIPQSSKREYAVSWIGAEPSR